MNSSTADWYYVTPSREKKGPFSRDEMLKLHLKGYIGRSTLVWTPGMPEWVQFSKKFAGIIPPPLPQEAHSLASATPQMSHASSESSDVSSADASSAVAPVTASPKPDPAELIEQALAKLSMQREQNKGFLGKLIDGDFGLSKTYWLFGVLVGFFATLVLRSITSIETLFVVFSMYAAYQLCVFSGTWRAANRYSGPAVWPVLTKIAVVLGFVMLIATFLGIIGLLKS